MKASIPQSGVVPQFPQLDDVVNKLSVAPVQTEVVVAELIGVVPQLSVNPALPALLKSLINIK